MIEHYSPGCIPRKLFATGRVVNGQVTARYEVDGRRYTTSPLHRIEFGEGHDLEVRFTESWFTDLDIRALENADAVTCHSITRLAPECKQEMNTATHWYIHPHDRECVVVGHRYHRHLPAVREMLRPSRGMPVRILSEQLLKSYDERVGVLLDGSVRAEADEDAVRLEALGQGYGYTVGWGSLAKKLSRAPAVTVRIEPDVEEAGFYLLLDEERELRILIESGEGDLGQVEVSVYGAWQGRETIPIVGGETRVSLPARPTVEGLVPLLVLIEGEDFLVAKRFEVLVLPTVLESSDRRFDGVFAEQMRSILMRTFFNVVPEDEPRGPTSYPLAVFPRNFTSHNLCAFGFHDLGLAHLEAYTEILKRDGFLAQDYDLNGNHVVDDPAGLMHVNANDGIGFYLLQLAKGVFHHPEKRVDVTGVDRAVRWLAMHTHWNGLLDDHSEPVTQHHSERLAGSPYAQGLCMAGLKAISEALRHLGEHELAEKAEWLFRFQIAGFRKCYDEIGFIRDRQRLAETDTDKIPCLSDYSMPCPSLVLLDPEVDVHDLDPLYERTLKELREDTSTPGNPWMFGRFHLAGGSYSQYGVMGSLLNLCRLEEAGGYLNEILKYSEDTRLRYVLPEGVAYEDDWYRVHHPELKARSPWVYKDLEEKEPGLPGGAINPGCLVQLTYWLYCADLICGISADSGQLKIWPKIPGYMDRFRVRGYHTRHGNVSYQYAKEKGRITFLLEKPAVEALVTLGPLPAIRKVTVGGEMTSFEEVKSGDGCFARLRLPEGEEGVRVEVTSE
ncbi:MAG: hypothetical protein V1800_08030 [Candidatus Latescibacterota bacterium]